MKTFRIYFNRELDWPQCWSVDEGDQTTEVNVCGFRIEDCPTVSASLSPDLRKRLQLDGSKHPVAWLEVQGALRLERGVAVIAPERRRKARP